MSDWADLPEADKLLGALTDLSDDDLEHFVGDQQDVARALTYADRIGARVATTSQLRRIFRESEQMGFNRKPPGTDITDRLDPRGKHLITPIMRHDFIDKAPAKMHWRCHLSLKLAFQNDPYEVTAVDMTERALKRLPRVRPKHRTLRDPKWHETLTLYMDLLRDLNTNPPLIGAANNDGEFIDVPAHPRLIDEAEPWFVDADMLMLVENAAPGLTEHQLTRDELVTQTGFAVLETPVWMEHADFGEVPIRVISWKPWPGNYLIDNTGQAMGNSILVMAWFDLTHPDFERSKVDMNYRGRLWPGLYTHFMDGDTVDASMGYANADDDMRRQLTALRQFVGALWLLSAQRLALVSGQKPARGLRRQAERQKIPSTVVVVRLRRAEPVAYEGEGRKVEWSHRWPVSGHWRRLDRDGLIKKTWVSPYIKGPADKPLLIKDRFYKFDR